MSISTQTIKKLFGLSGNSCAFPNCTFDLVSAEKKIIIAEICHIAGEKRKAARYNPNQTIIERESFENLLLMCRNHHWIIDYDEETYTVEYLHELKNKHIEENSKTPPSKITTEISEKEILNLIRRSENYDILFQKFEESKHLSIDELVYNGKYSKALDLLLENGAKVTRYYKSKGIRIYEQH